MAEVLMYCTRACPYCRMALRLLEKKGAEIKTIQVDDMPEQRAEMTRITGRTSVPQIFIGETHVGGYSELSELDLAGRLDSMLNT